MRPSLAFAAIPFVDHVGDPGVPRRRRGDGPERERRKLSARGRSHHGEVRRSDVHHDHQSMAWNHAGDANGGNCTHIGTDHTDATIVATITNGTITYKCSYVGSATNTGPACVKP
jgi:hypothetical protein